MKIQITTFNSQGLKSISGFSKNKVEHITKTKQWDYVMNTILKTSK